MNELIVIIYVALFVASVLCLLKKKYRQATLIMLVFATGGMSILPNEAGPFKATHLTFIYIFLFYLINFRSIKQYGIINKEVKWLIRLALFFVFSIFLSIMYYGFPIVESIATGMRYLLLLSLFIYSPLKIKDYKTIFTIVFYITFVTSILYIAQSIIGLQLLPSSSTFDGEEKTGGLGGLYHFLNIPVFCIVFIPISIFCKTMIPKKLQVIAPIVFFSALFVTLFRTHIVSMILCILIIMFLKGELKKTITPIITILIMLTLFGGIFYTRVTEQNDSASDISAVLSGRLDQADYQAKDGMTLLYRFAWIAERLDYMKDRPVDLMCGLGMISEKKTQNKYYHFYYGLNDPNTGLKNQVGTPDIAWGNLLTRFGLLGSFMLIAFYFAYMSKLWRFRKVDDLSLTLYAYLLSNLLASFSGATISDPIFWQPLFFLFAFANKRIEFYQRNVII